MGYTRGRKWNEETIRAEIYKRVNNRLTYIRYIKRENLNNA